MATANPYKAHSLALVESTEIGEGTRIWAFAHVMPGVRIGPDCNIGDHAFLETGVQIGRGVTIKNHALLWNGVRVADYVFIGPNVVFTNDPQPRSPRFPEVSERYRTEAGWMQTTEIGEGASIGANATICCGITLGAFCMVGAGSVVTRDVPPHARVWGNPARLQGWVDRQGRVLEEQGEFWVERASNARYVIQDGTLRPL